MRSVLVLTIVSGCGFSVQGQPGNDDAKRDSAGGEGGPTDMATDGATDAPIDAAIDAPIDARICPAAPAGCTAFTCAGSSSCYYVCGQGNMDQWTDARDSCVDDGLGCLVTINDQAENDCVLANTNASFTNQMYVWLGWVQAGNGAEPNGGWGWQCGSSSYVAGNWGQAGGEPNNVGGNEDCALMIQGGAWIDGACGTNARWVCELP